MKTWGKETIPGPLVRMKFYNVLEWQELGWGGCENRICLIITAYSQLCPHPKGHFSPCLLPLNFLKQRITATCSSRWVQPLANDGRRGFQSVPGHHPELQSLQGTFHPGLFVFGKCGCVHPPPLQKQTSIKAEAGPTEDTGGEIQPSQASTEESQSAGSRPKIKVDSHLPLTQVKLERAEVATAGLARLCPGSALGPGTHRVCSESCLRVWLARRSPLTTIKQHTQVCF